MRRIASLLSSATEILYTLGLGDRVVAVSHECDYPRDVANKPRATRSRIDSTADSRAIDEQVRAMLSAGEPLYTVDETLLASLAPDLIVTQAQCDVCAVRYEDVVQAVARQPALENTQVLSLAPTSLEDILNDVRRVGEAAGVSEQAEQVVRSLQSRLDAISTALAGPDAVTRPRVAVIEWIEPMMLAGNWVPELVERAGGINAFTKASEHSPYIAWEQVLDFQPEVIVVSLCGFDLARTVQESARLRDLPGWQAVPAVRAGRVYAIDGNAYFNRSGPRIVDSLEILAHLLHPESVERPAWADSDSLPWESLT